MSELHGSDLENALPKVLEKLRELRDTLSPEEAEVFAEIIRSATRHTEAIDAADKGTLEKIRYMKPMSVHATTEIRRQFLDLPQLMNVTED